MTGRPDYYERAPDGKQWPGTLPGLLKAIDDTAMESFMHAGEYTLMSVRGVISTPFRVYRNGTYTAGEL